MTFADLCILIAALMPYACVGYAKSLSKNSFNNADPRNPKSYAGEAERAHGAHLNGFEAFPFFAVAVLFAEYHAAPQTYINILAGLFILLRVIYIFLYIKGYPTLRSGIFGLGFLSVVGIFLLPFFTH